MTSQQSVFPTNLFYSYCHKDIQHKVHMEKALTVLQQKRLLRSWSDQNILPGQTISQKVREEMDKADIMVFLLSQDFIASEECMREWDYAKQLAKEKFLFRIPIILKDCAWKDLLENDGIKALPTDGKPVTKFGDHTTAWQEVYEGIKAVINELRSTFTPKPSFLKEMKATDIPSQQHTTIQDIFVFPLLSHHSLRMVDGQMPKGDITNQGQLLEKKFVLIHGEEMSGKTALGRYLFLSLVENSAPVLHLDLQGVPKNLKEEFLRTAYHDQFNGEYFLWKKQGNKTLILDNLSPDPHLIDFVVSVKNIFDRIVITLSSDIFNSFFRDEKRLADFHEVKIEPLTHKRQEELIRKRLALTDREEPITDGFVDQVENRVNSIVISNKIVPRYPFYVLSILQTYEKYMPDNLSITSYGHCYYVLILANLIKAGISRSDSDINACFNFAENLAFKIYQQDTLGNRKTLDFDKFAKEYNQRFTISNSILNRLRNRDYGIIVSDGHFRTTYMYYFFLGRFLSKNSKTHKAVIEKMCEESHLASNHLTLLFIIHHTDDNQIIDNILLGTMCTLDDVPTAKLSREETKKFENILSALPPRILSNNSVREEREREREARDIHDQQVDTEEEIEEAEGKGFLNDCYRILKNNRIMGQILRNKYGSLERRKIKEIIETIAGGGLRLVNSALRDEDEIADCARYLHEKYPKYGIFKIKNSLQILSFLWTVKNIEEIVSSTNCPEIRQIVNEVVDQQSTPAYDLIGYFSRLDNAEKLTEPVQNELQKLLKRYKYRFLHSVLSIRTQHYMNTHTSDVSIEQAVCSLLKIKYHPRTL